MAVSTNPAGNGKVNERDPGCAMGRAPQGLLADSYGP